MIGLTALSIALFAIVVLVVLEARRTEEGLRRLAMHDPLTGVFNRRAFMELAAREVTRARRTRAPFAVLMMDLDHFKRVNDRHGHLAGDRVLADFARRTAQCLRAGDLVGRYGGEEFCAFLPGAEAAEALGVAERIRSRAGAKPLGRLADATTVSIGVSLCPADWHLEKAISAADAALYRAKDGGRDRVAVSRSGKVRLAA